jgi:pSer/pThr/pTyr-binding forkhead associated (FHA) protein
MENPQLVVTDQSGAQQTFDLPVGSVVVGRSDAADIPIGSEYLSERHVQLTWDGSVLRITDLDSTNGTRVNGTRLVDSVDLRDHDRIVLGTVEGYVVLPVNGPHTQTMPVDTGVPNATHAPAAIAPVQPPPKGSNSVFVSYAREESAKAQAVVGHLRSRGWHVIIDQDVLRPGEVWNQSLSQHIADSSVVLALISPAAAGSAWVNQELVAAVNGRRPVLPLVIDSYNVGETQRRFAILGDRQWLTLDSPAGQFDPLELDAVSDHLTRLARGTRPAHAVTSRERLGSVIMWLGILGLVATVGWFGVGFTRVGSGFLDIVRESEGIDLASEDPFAVIDSMFTDYVGEMTGLFVAFPVFFASLVAVITGWVMRRNARKRRLMGR